MPETGGRKGQSVGSKVMAEVGHVLGSWILC